MKLVHYSDAPVGELVSVDPVESDAPGKPRGFWVSVESEDGDGWREWCLGFDWGLSRLTHAHDVELAPGARILRLSNEADIDAFGNKYRAPPPWLERLDGIEAERYIFRISELGYWLDWSKVAEHWQGIIIAPYVRSRRRHRGCFWYYGWDCASGCIWDVSAIAGVTLREVVPVPGPEQPW